MKIKKTVNALKCRLKSICKNNDLQFIQYIYACLIHHVQNAAQIGVMVLHTPKDAFKKYQTRPVT